MSTDNENRTYDRYPVRTMAKIEYSDSDGERVFYARTKDICSSGVYILTQKGIPIGTTLKVTFDLEVEGVSPDGEKQVGVTAVGSVCRSETDGFAVSF